MSTLLTEPPQAESLEKTAQPDVPPPPLPLEERLGPGRFPGLWKPIRSAFWAIHVVFGTVCLILILAILAAIPGLNILTLGYLVEPQRRVALSGRLRDGFPMLALAPRFGIIGFMCGLMLISIGIFAAGVSDATIILGESSDAVITTTGWLRAGKVSIAITMVLYIASTLHAAGKRDRDPKVETSIIVREIREFREAWVVRRVILPMICAFVLLTIAIAVLSQAWVVLLIIFALSFVGELLRAIVPLLWCLRRREGWTELMDGIENILRVVKPVHHFWLGLKAFFGAVLWLLIPTGLVVAYSSPGRTEPIFGILSFLGVLLLIPVTAWLPQLQVHQAVTGKFRSIFSISAARQVIRNAPFSWMITTILLFVMTFPLYLAKIRLPPADAMWLITPFFIVLTYPTRILVAWAYHRGTFKFEDKANFFLRWGCRLVMLPLLFLHAGFVFFTPAISELGKNAPLEHQAFLGPVPYSQWGKR